MNINVLNIFGYCFIFELFILVTVVFSSILRSFVDRKTKERNYKYMVKNEERLRKEAEKEKMSNGEKNIKDILNFSIDKEQGILDFKEPVNLKKESIEFRIKGICIEPDENSKITRGMYDIPDIIPITYDKENLHHHLKATLQIPVYETVNGTNIPTTESESVTIDLSINPENGTYVNNSSKIIKNIDIYCLINTETNEEEKRNKEFNKKLTTSEKDMNELLENAVTEGLNENKNEYQYQIWNRSPRNSNSCAKTSITDFDPIKDELEFEFILFTYRENNEVKIIYAEEINDNKFTVSFENNIFILTKMVSGHHISIVFDPNTGGYTNFNLNKTSKEVESVYFKCIHKKDNE